MARGKGAALALAAAVLVAAARVAPVHGDTTTTPCVGVVAGVGPRLLADGMAATSAPLDNPAGVAVDDEDGIYFTSGNSVVMMTRDGGLTLVAGRSGQVGDSGDGGTAAEAQLRNPLALAFDAAGDLLVADSDNSRVRRITMVNGTISAFAGSGTSGYEGDGGPATAALMVRPSALAVARAAGVTYIADTGNNCVRRVVGGIITNVAGVCGGVGGYSGDGGPATAAELLQPYSVALVPGSGNLLIADTMNSAIRLLTVATGVLTTVVGTGVSDVTRADATVAPLAITLNQPGGVLVSGAGDIYIADSGAMTVRVLRAGSDVVTPFAGDGTDDTPAEGPDARNVSTLLPRGLAMLSDGTLVVAVTMAARIATVAPSGALKLVAGWASTYEFGSTAVAAADAAFVSPESVAVGDDGAVYVGDSMLGMVVRLRPADAMLEVVVGTGTYAPEPSSPATRAGTQVHLAGVTGLATNASGAIYIAEDVSMVRVLEPRTGLVSTVAGKMTRGFSGNGGPATSAELDTPNSVASTPDGTLFISDSVNNVVRRVLPNGNIDVYAGTGEPGYTGDGGPATSADLGSVRGLAYDAAGGVLYMAARFSHVVRAVNSGGTISTVVGVGGDSGYDGDEGPATLAKLSLPSGLAYDARNGDLYIADTGNNRVRRVRNGDITTVMGTGEAWPEFSAAPAAPLKVGLKVPIGLALDGAGNLYVADTYNSVVRVMVTGDTIPCAVGHSCACGQAVLCTDVAGFCPANSVTPVPVSRGYYSLASAASGGRYGQARCPTGAFCAGGALTACPAGTYGRLAGQADVAACEACPAGTYNANARSTSSAACLPCPAGTFSAVTGAASCMRCPVNTFNAATGSASAGACTPCTGAGKALGGAAACFTTAGTITVSDERASFEQSAALAVVDASAADRATELTLMIAVAVVCAGSLPLLCFLCITSTLPAHWRCPCCSPILRSGFRSIDQYSMARGVPEGKSPVNQSSTVGGTVTLLALGVIAAMAASLVVQFAINNTLVSQSILPAGLPKQQEFAPLATTRLAGGVPSPIAPDLATGFLVEVVAMGPQCATFNWSAAALVAGNFTLTTRVDTPTARTSHVLACPDCAFGPLSDLTLLVQGSCQSLEVTTVTVGIEGGTKATRYSLGRATPSYTSSQGWLVAATLPLSPRLAVLHDEVASVTTRALTHEAAVPEQTFWSAPLTGDDPRITITVNLPAAVDYVAIQVLPIVKPTQLASSIIGLSGLLGAFAIAFRAVNRFKGCSRRRGASDAKVLSSTPSAASAGYTDEGSGDPGRNVSDESMATIANPMGSKRKPAPGVEDGP